MKYWLACLFFILLYPLSAIDGQSIDVVLWAKQHNIQFYWESGREVGLLMKEGKQVSFDARTALFLMGSSLYQSRGRYQDHQFLMDDETASMLLSYLGGEVLGVSHQVAIILIDAGHGGRDPGAVGKHDGKTINEKDITLAIALYLEQLLKARYPNKKILMTRRTDHYLSLEERVAIANNQQLKAGEVEIYLSIHANSSAFNKAAKGYEVWRLPPTVTRSLFNSSNVSNSTNEAVNRVLNEEYAEESKNLATFVLRAMEQGLGKITLNRGQREQSWFVVKNAKMAAVLVEVGFVSNKEEALRLNDEKYLKLIAKTLYTGLGDFIDYFEK